MALYGDKPSRRLPLLRHISSSPCKPGRADHNSSDAHAVGGGEDCALSCDPYEYVSNDDGPIDAASLGSSTPHQGCHADDTEVIDPRHTAAFSRTFDGRFDGTFDGTCGGTFDEVVDQRPTAVLQGSAATENAKPPASSAHQALGVMAAQPGPGPCSPLAFISRTRMLSSGGPDIKQQGGGPNVVSRPPADSAAVPSVEAAQLHALGRLGRRKLGELQVGDRLLSSGQGPDVKQQREYSLPSAGAFRELVAATRGSDPLRFASASNVLLPPLLGRSRSSDNTFD